MASPYAHYFDPQAPTNEQLLIKHRWRPHPHFVGLWNRDGGEWTTTASALRIEADEQRRRDARRGKSSEAQEEAGWREEIEDRRRWHDERVGPGRVIKKRYRKGWGE